MSYYQTLENIIPTIAGTAQALANKIRYEGFRKLDPHNFNVFSGLLNSYVYAVSQFTATGETVYNDNALAINTTIQELLKCEDFCLVKNQTTNAIVDPVE